MMVTNLKDFFEDSEEFREEFGGILEGQLELDFYNKTFSNQVISYEGDTLDSRIQFWLLIVHRGGPMPDNVNNYHLDEILNLWRRAEDLAMQELVKIT